MQGNSANSSNATVLIGPWVGLCPARRNVFSRGCHTSFSEAAKKKKLSTPDYIRPTYEQATQEANIPHKLTNLLPDTICDYKN